MLLPRNVAVAFSLGQSASLSNQTWFPYQTRHGVDPDPGHGTKASVAERETPNYSLSLQREIESNLQPLRVSHFIE